MSAAIMLTGLEEKTEAELAELHRTGWHMINSTHWLKLPYGSAAAERERIWHVAAEGLLSLVHLETTRRVLADWRKNHG